MLPAIGRSIADAGRPAGANDYLLGDRLGAKLNTLIESRRPVDPVDRRLGVDHAPLLAGAAVVAGGSAAVGYGVDGGVDRPPVPAQFVKTASGDLPAAAERQRRLARSLFGRVGGIARQPADADQAVLQIVIRLEVGIGQRPVVADAVEGAGPEI